MATDTVLEAFKILKTPFSPVFTVVVSMRSDPFRVMPWGDPGLTAHSYTVEPIGMFKWENDLLAFNKNNYIATNIAVISSLKGCHDAKISSC